MNLRPLEQSEVEQHIGNVRLLNKQPFSALMCSRWHFSSAAPGHSHNLNQNHANKGKLDIIYADTSSLAVNLIDYQCY
jgi:hypothetical protein